MQHENEEKSRDINLPLGSSSASPFCHEFLLRLTMNSFYPAPFCPKETQCLIKKNYLYHVFHLRFTCTGGREEIRDKGSFITYLRWFAFAAVNHHLDSPKDGEAPPTATERVRETRRSKLIEEEKYVICLWSFPTMQRRKRRRTRV